LSKLFVEPRHIRGGVGRPLLARAVAEARQRGAERLTILADPNAADFYDLSPAPCSSCASVRDTRFMSQ
jgi:GNAT superfamily N-acetyltransferase